METDFSIAAKFAELKQALAESDARIAALEAMLESARFSGSRASVVGDVLVDSGGGEGGSFTGNTTDSVEIEGDVLFKSASDANVEIATETRTNSSQEEENVITVGVYYV